MKAKSANSSKMTQIKTMLRYGILALLMLNFSSCGEFLTGKPQTPDYLEIQSGSLGCLDNVSDDIKKFLESTASNDELDKTVNCITSTLTEFQNKVEGRAQADAFTADEVYDIFSTFVKEAQLTRDAAHNMITMKAALIGGSPERITKTEIDSLKAYMLVIKGEAKKLLPYIKLYFMKDTDRAYTKEFIGEGFKQLGESLKVLMSASKISESGYTFEDFKNLIINLMRLSESDAGRVDVLSKINTVLNGARLDLTAPERLKYIDSFMEFLRLFSMHANGYAAFNYSTPERLTETLDFLEQAVALLENSMQYQQTGIISVSGLDALAKALVESGCIPYKMTAGTARDFYRTIFVRVFEAGYFGNVSTFYGIKPINFIHIKRELSVYRVYSSMLAKIAVNGSAILPDMQSRMSALVVADELPLVEKFDRNNQLQIFSIVEEQRKEFLETTPIVFKNDKMAVAMNQSTWTQSWKDLAQAYGVKSLSRFLMLGWAQKFQVLNTNTALISEIGMTKWYNEFKPMGIAIKMLDPRIDNAGLNSLKAGNLFTRAGNGDDFLTQKEAFEYLGLLISAGKGVSEPIRTDLKTLNCNLAELDIYGNPFNTESCLYRTLHNKYRTYFSTLPYLVSYLDGLSYAQFDTFFGKVLEVVRQDSYNTGVKVETSEINGVSGLLYFIEGLYMSHDTNMNWQLSESEIRTAYPKFKDIAAEFAHKTSQAQIDEFTSWKGDLAGYGCFKEEDLIRESFIFLVYNGRTPGMSDFNLEPCLLGKPLLTFKGEVDRTEVVNTFKALSAILK